MQISIRMKRQRVVYSDRNEISHLDHIEPYKVKQRVSKHYKLSYQYYRTFNLPKPHIHNLSQSAIDYNLIELKFIEIIGHWFTILALATMGLFIYLITLSLRLQSCCVIACMDTNCMVVISKSRACAVWSPTLNKSTKTTGGYE